MNLSKLLNKIFGKKEYNVTVVNVSGSLELHTIYNKSDLDLFVRDLNKMTYWDVQKIEKFRKYDFIYEKNVVHSPLYFSLEDVTERETVWGTEYSFLKKDKSLSIVNRVSTKETLKNGKRKEESSLCD